MKKRTKLTICLGVICALLVAISSWYTIAFNNSRFIVPMDLSEYVFRVQERYKENKMKAQSVANKTSLSIIFLAILILGQGKLMDNLEYTLIALVIVIALSIALEIFLGEYLLYHYDNDEQFGESEE